MRRDDPEPKNRWGSMAVVSVGIHALVIGGAVMLASGSGTPRTLYAPSMSVGLVSPGEAGLPPGGGGAPGGKTPPQKTDRPRKESAPEAKVSATEPPRVKRPPAKKTPGERPRPRVEKPERGDSRVEPPKPKPEKAKKPEEVVRVPKKAPHKKPPPKKRAAARRKDAPPKKARKKHREGPPAVSAKARRKPAGKKLAGKELDALERIRRRILARAGRPAGRRGGGGPGRPGGGGIGGAGERDAYKNELARIFYAAWVLPRSLPTEDLKVDLIIQIDRGGRIVKSEIERSSGNRLFDESVLRAVAKVQTADVLPPLPPEIPGGVLVQGLRFDPKFRRGFTR